MPREHTTLAHEIRETPRVYRECRTEGDSRAASLRWAVRSIFDVWWDGHPLHLRWWYLHHPPTEFYWHPQVNLHLKRWNPLFWLVLLWDPE